MSTGEQDRDGQPEPGEQQDRDQQDRDQQGRDEQGRDEQDSDAAEVDRVFAELVAGYHLTAERPEPSAGHRPVAPVEPASPREVPYAFAPPHPESRRPDELADDDRRDEPEDRYEPDPPPPLPKPAWPVLLAWLGMGYAVLTVLAVAVGVRLAGWAGWLGILGFVGGFAVLVARLPRQRPPGSGDGAVV